MKTTSRRGMAALVLLMVAIGVAGPLRAQSVCDGISPVQHTGLVRVDIATGVPGRLVFVASPPGDADRRFIVDQDGRIFLHRRGDAPTSHSLVLDLTAVVTSTGNEQGLLGLAFDPDFDVTGQFYVNYTEETGFFQSRTIVARYTMDAMDPDVADPGSELRILGIDQPQFETNHNAGWIDFGPDGFLYIATGDGGGGGDQHGTCGNGQNRSILLGKILRIDVRGIASDPVAAECDAVFGNYQVPGDNPFVAGAGCDEIWSYGLRNPWRNSFDRWDGSLYIADVGQRCWEEINYRPGGSAGGENYGWRQMEGGHCYAQGGSCEPANVPCAGSPNCNDASLVLPVAEYKNGNGHPDGEGCSVTGGYVYRGCRIPGLTGTYFYGDYCEGFVRSFEVSGGVAVNPRDWTAGLGVTGPNALTSFGEDARGELLVVERNGTVSKVLPPLSDFQVSGPGASPFLLHRSQGWTWEDLAYTSEHRVVAYKVYRGVPGGLFQCIEATMAPEWTGDPDEPAPGDLLAYVVTAVDAGGVESGSGDTARNLDPAACP